MSTPAVLLPATFGHGPHTCICVARMANLVKFIPMSSLVIETNTYTDFDSVWEARPEYPVKRAAERYLASVQYRTIPAKVHALLSGIAASAADYEPFESLNAKPKGTSTMAKKAPNGITSIINAAKPAAKPAAKAPAKAKPAAKAPAKAKPAASKPVSKPLPKSAAAAKPAAAAAPKAPRAPDTTKYKMGDITSVKRGFLAEFVEKAQVLKSFTRAEVEAACGEAAGTKEHATMRTYFPYCVGKGIFTAVK